MKRNRRAAVEDLWMKTVRLDDDTIEKQPSARHGIGLRWRARYVDSSGREHTKAFKKKPHAQTWLDKQTSAVVTGTHLAPRDANTTVKEWCEIWLDTYKRKGFAKNTIECANATVKTMIAEWGDMKLSDVEPEHIIEWRDRLTAEGRKASSLSRTHGRMKQVFEYAVFKKRLASNPCSRETAPRGGKKKMYCITTEQVWALHDAMPERMQVAILLGAFAGLRIGEVCGLRVSDVDFVRGVVHPKQQWRGAKLKNSASDAPIPIPRDLTLLLSASVKKFPSEMMVTSAGTGQCCPDSLQFAVAKVRDDIEGLPERFSFHDLRHFFASMLIGSGADLMKVQARMRHDKASTTLNVYGHLWPDDDETTNNAVSAAIAARQKAAN